MVFAKRSSNPISWKPITLNTKTQKKLDRPTCLAVTLQHGTVGDDVWLNVCLARINWGLITRSNFRGFKPRGKPGGR